MASDTEAAVTDEVPTPISDQLSEDGYDDLADDAFTLERTHPAALVRIAELKAEVEQLKRYNNELYSELPGWRDKLQNTRKQLAEAREILEWAREYTAGTLEERISDFLDATKEK